MHIFKILNFLRNLSFHLQLPYKLICNTNWEPAINNVECANFDGSLKVMREHCDGKNSCKVTKSDCRSTNQLNI